MMSQLIYGYAEVFSPALYFSRHLLSAQLYENLATPQDFIKNNSCDLVGVNFI